MSHNRICVLELVSKPNSNKFKLRCSIHFSSQGEYMHPVDQFGLVLMRIAVLMGSDPVFTQELERLLERFPLNDNEEAA